MTGLCLAFSLRFEEPAYLLLLLTIPLVIALSFRSLSGLGPGRRITALVFRSAVIIVMVLALAGLQRVQTNDDLTVAFIVDRSNSVAPQRRQAALEFIARSQEGMRQDDLVGVVGADGRSAVLQLPMNQLKLQEVFDPIQPDQTNLAASARLAMAMFDERSIRRVVLISDGNENIDEIMEEAENYAAANVPIDVLPVRYQYDREVVMEQLRAPATAAAEETINLRVQMRSPFNAPVSGRIKLFHNDQPVQIGPGGDGYPVTLPPGRSAYVLPQPLRAAGAHRFRARFEPDDPSIDTIAANNEGRAFTVVSGQGKILIVTTPENQESALLLGQALEREKLVAEVQLVGDTPLTQENLLGYSLVVLDNVPADLVPLDQQNALQLYVRELGGGLVMLGGDESYAAGGWIDSPVEDVMPVEFEIKSKQVIPQGALVLIMHSSELPQGNYLGRRVAIAATKTLTSRDLIGVLAYHYHDPDKNWVVPIQPAGTKTAIIRNLQQMSMGDLQDLTPVVRQAVDALKALRGVPAKHMIITSDFDPVFPLGPGGAGAQLLQEMRDHNISCSTISIGYGLHVNGTLAQQIADGAAEGSTHYAVRNPSNLPQIFIKEARLIRRRMFQEDLQNGFELQLTSPMSPVVPGLAETGVPKVYGYLATTPKPLADVPIVRNVEEDDRSDPILAHWQAGLGRTVAFTSGMWPRWGNDWVAWPSFSTVWAQIARWASRQSEATAFDVTTTQEGERAKIRIDALDKNASAINFMSVEGTVIRPDGTPVPLRLTQTGPGRYEGEIDTTTSGSYVVNMVYSMGAGENARQGTLQTGVSVAYSPEYRELATNLPLLTRIADRTNGRVLDEDSATQIFDRAGLPLAETRRPIWEDLLRLMLLLFLLDVAVRRIAITPQDIATKFRNFMRDIAGSRPQPDEAAAVLSNLKGARQQTRTGLAGRSETGPTPARDARYEAPKSDEQVSEELSQALGGASEVDQPVVARPTRKQPRVDEGQYTSRLLAAKKRAREQRDQNQDDDSAGQ